jgi:hypothetical protein
VSVVAVERDDLLSAELEARGHDAALNAVRAPPRKRWISPSFAFGKMDT